MMKILWLTNIPSPYRVDFFNELGKLCELTVLFEKKAASDRDDSWKNFEAKNFTPVFLKTYTLYFYFPLLYQERHGFLGYRLKKCKGSFKSYY